MKTESGKRMSVAWVISCVVVWAAMSLSWTPGGAPVLTSVSYSATEDFHYVMPEELLKEIEAKGDVVILDARDPDDYNKAHIKGAMKVVSPKQIQESLPKNKMIVVYCDCGEEESAKFLAQALIRAGYPPGNIRVLKGGWYKWLDLGYLVEKN
jgi:rhodanese-related sulfurtransferase